MMHSRLLLLVFTLVALLLHINAISSNPFRRRKKAPPITVDDDDEAPASSSRNGIPKFLQRTTQFTSSSPDDGGGGGGGGGGDEEPLVASTKKEVTPKSSEAQPNTADPHLQSSLLAPTIDSTIRKRIPNMFHANRDSSPPKTDEAPPGDDTTSYCSSTSSKSNDDDPPKSRMVPGLLPTSRNPLLPTSKESVPESSQSNTTSRGPIPNLFGRERNQGRGDDNTPKAEPRKNWVMPNLFPAHDDNDDSDNITLRDQSSASPSPMTPRVVQFKRFNKWRIQSIHRGATKAASETIAGWGFAKSIAVNLLSARSQFQQRLRPTVVAMQNYLKETGISQELSQSMTKKMYDNVVILWRIQRQYRAEHDVRNVVLHWNQTLPDMEEASRFMRFATAAYGDQMISAVRWGRRASGYRIIPRSTKQRLSEHVNVRKEDIIIMDLDFGGQREHLHHFVATDHANKQVVLAIRGTFSIPDLIVDAAGFSKPFCGGEAHSEMAQMAEQTWSAARPYIVSALERHEDYSLVITGHSLGAGVAALVNILCHQRGREQVNGRPVRCFAYGCPPVYSPLELVPDAVASTICYMHGNDIVPFLSISSVRRLVSTLSVIDKESSKHIGSRSSLVYGRSRPSKKMRTAALQGVETKIPKRGAPTLAPPAASVVWTKELDTPGVFDAKVCDARKVASRLSIPISKHAMADHSLTSYEEALHYLQKHPQDDVAAKRQDDPSK